MYTWSDERNFKVLLFRYLIKGISSNLSILAAKLSSNAYRHLPECPGTNVNEDIRV